MSRVELPRGQVPKMSSQANRVPSRPLTFDSHELFRATYMLKPGWRRIIIKALMAGGAGSLLSKTALKHHGIIPHGPRSAEAIMTYGQSGFDFGPITPTELQANDELRQKVAQRRASNATTSSEGAPERKKSSDEIMHFLGGTPLGRIQR